MLATRGESTELNICEEWTRKRTNREKIVYKRYRGKNVYVQDGAYFSCLALSRTVWGDMRTGRA